MSCKLWQILVATAYIIKQPELVTRNIETTGQILMEAFLSSEKYYPTQIKVTNELAECKNKLHQ